MRIQSIRIKHWNEMVNDKCCTQTKMHQKLSQSQNHHIYSLATNYLQDTICISICVLFVAIYVRIKIYDRK